MDKGHGWSPVLSPGDLCWSVDPSDDLTVLDLLDSHEAGLRKLLSTLSGWGS